MSSDNPILYYEGDIPIRKTNPVRLNLNESEYKRIAIAANRSRLPVALIIAIAAQPCPVCNTESITIVIPKNLLSTNKANNGRSLTNRLSNDKQE